MSQWIRKNQNCWIKDCVAPSEGYCDDWVPVYENGFSSSVWQFACGLCTLSSQEFVKCCHLWQVLPATSHFCIGQRVDNMQELWRDLGCTQRSKLGWLFRQTLKTVLHGDNYMNENPAKGVAAPQSWLLRDKGQFSRDRKHEGTEHIWGGRRSGDSWAVQGLRRQENEHSLIHLVR